MKKFIFITLLFIGFTSCNSQNDNKDYEKLLQTKTYLVKNGFSKISFSKDYQVLKKYDKMDSLDIVFFSTPYLEIMLLDSLQKNNEATYKILLQEINKIRDKKDYKKSRELLLLSEKMKNKIIVKDQWEEDKLILKKLGMKDDEMTVFKRFIARYKNKKVTYGEAIKIFKETLEAMNMANETKDIYKFREFNNFDKVLETAKNERKSILLYFTGYAAQNCRVMEEKVFKNKHIKNLLNQKFIAYAIYVDSREVLPKSYISKYSGKEIKTIGQQGIELEKKFDSYTQPFFVIIDKNGKVLRKRSYTSNIEVFLDFLKQIK